MISNKGKNLPRLITDIVKPVFVFMISLGVSKFSAAQAINTYTAQTGILSLPNKSTNYPVLYGAQPDSKLVQSIGFLKGSYLEGTPSSTPVYGLTGRIAGLFTSQFS